VCVCVCVYYVQGLVLISIKRCANWVSCRPPVENWERDFNYLCPENCEKCCVKPLFIIFLSVRPHGTTRVPLYNLAKHFKLGIFNKICLPN
jgi:hypothetical protein